MHIKNSKLTPLAFLMVLFLSSNARSSVTPSYLNISERLSITDSLGYLFGESQEFVYDLDTGDKISQLNWKFQGTPIIQHEINYILSPWLDANARGWITVIKGKTAMDDYDWLTSGQAQWSHWSHHPESELQQASEFDLNLRAWSFQQPSFRLGGIAGYQHTLFSFASKGGCYIYNNGAMVGCVPIGSPGIDYRQTYSTPYVGLIGNYFTDRFELSASFRLSNLVKATAVDQHYRRALTFKDQGSSFNFYNATIAASYWIRPHFRIFTKDSASYIPNK